VSGGDWRLAVFPELPSTATLLAERAAAGEPEGLAVLALRQSAGRGRAGRGWASPVGNLYLSVLLRPATPAREAAQWSLLAGVALHEAASGLIPGLTLKWPNDLLLGGAKCAGILAETALAPDGAMDWLGLGFGVNLAAAPALAERATAHLGAAEAPEAFARRLLARLAYWRGVQQVQGFAPVRAAWQARGPALGSALRQRGLAGRYLGLAEDGALLLDEDGTTRRVTTGEIDGTE
jgi:BirA family biotin operon repressor/biotin-[acetyl-CoA-carboxylase] ligase